MLLLIYGIVFTNWGPTDGRTDGRTDIASYRDAYAASKNAFGRVVDHRLKRCASVIR